MDDIWLSASPFAPILHLLFPFVVTWLSVRVFLVGVQVALEACGNMWQSVLCLSTWLSCEGNMQMYWRGCGRSKISPQFSMTSPITQITACYSLLHRYCILELLSSLRYITHDHRHLNCTSNFKPHCWGKKKILLSSVTDSWLVLLPWMDLIKPCEELPGVFFNASQVIV